MFSKQVTSSTVYLPVSGPRLEIEALAKTLLTVRPSRQHLLLLYSAGYFFAFNRLPLGLC